MKDAPLCNMGPSSLRLPYDFDAMAAPIFGAYFRMVRRGNDDGLAQSLASMGNASHLAFCIFNTQYCCAKPPHIIFIYRFKNKQNLLIIMNIPLTSPLIILALGFMSHPLQHALQHTCPHNPCPLRFDPKRFILHTSRTQTPLTNADPNRDNLEKGDFIMQKAHPLLSDCSDAVCQSLHNFHDFKSIDSTQTFLNQAPLPPKIQWFVRLQNIRLMGMVDGDGAGVQNLIPHC